MKTKLFFFAALCMAALTVQAQKCVVLNFQIGDNVTAEEVEAVSYEFRSTFNPSCYTVEEKSKVNRVLSSLGFKAATMSKDQIRKLGREMTATVVVYGSLSKFMDEYTLDVNAMDVSTGTTCANQNNTFRKTEYRTHTRSVSQGLILKLCNSSLVAQAGYIDLGLPSGTLWKNSNATGFYTYEEAVSRFGNDLPTKEQWEELKTKCLWNWTSKGYKVTGLNGNFITLPASGYRNCSGGVDDVRFYGDYWSSTPDGSGAAWYLAFHLGGVDVYNGSRCYGYSVRLVQDK